MANRSSNKSKTDPAIKDFWRTSPRAIADAEHLIGRKFTLDAAAANADVAKAPRFITPEMDALASEWDGQGGAVWCNPPFSNKRPFLDRGHFMARKYGQIVMMMTPYEPTTGWFRDHVKQSGAIIFEPDGRYGYCHPETGEEMGTPEFPSCFVAFTGFEFPAVTVGFKRYCAEQKAEAK